MKIISVQTMRELDRQSIAGGVTGLDLMERAGTAAYAELRAFMETTGAAHCRRVTVLAGKGNNGGDAYVVARLLAKAARRPVHVYSVCPLEDLRGDALHSAQRLPEGTPVTVCPGCLPEDAFRSGTVIVDGLLGTGVCGPLRPPCDVWIRQVNACELPTVALDIPSGVDGDSGAVSTAAIRADLTVTMGLPKRGLLAAGGRPYCGRLVCVDIGLAAPLVTAAPSAAEALFADDIRPLLGRRPSDGHKGTFGHVLVIGGSPDYVGAPLLAGAAALRAGAGLVTVALPAATRALMPARPLALICRSIPDADGGHLTPGGLPTLADVRARATAIVLGPGVGGEPDAHTAVRQVLGWGLPTVLDADGLRAAAQDPSCLDRTAPTILTPHPGEMGVLLRGVGLAELEPGPRAETAVAVARRTGAVVVLKGQGSVVAAPDGRMAINTSGTDGLASGGTGDVLAGLVGGLLAQGIEAWDAARAAVFIHGRAAELACNGARALIADDLLELLGPAIRSVTPFA